MGLLRALFPPARRVMLVGLLVDLGVACMALGAQFLAIELKASPLVLGLLGMVSAAAYAVGCVFSGSVSDRFGRKVPAMLACLVAGTVWLAMSLAHSPYHLLLLMPFSGGALCFLWPSMQAWLAEFSGHSPRVLNRNLSLFNIAWTAGIMTGPLVAGYTWKYSHAVAFIFPAALSYLGAWVIHKTPTVEGPASEVAIESDHHSPELTQFFLLLAWLGNFASWYARAVVSSLYPKLGTELHFSHELVGFLIFVVGFAQLVMFGLTRFSERWHYRVGVLVAAETLGLAGLLVAALTSSAAVTALAFTAVGLCGGVTYVASLTYALHGHAGSRGKRSGFHEAVLGSGAVLGPLVGGVLAQGLSPLAATMPVGEWAHTLNLRAPLAAGALVFGIAILGQLLLYPRCRALRKAAAAGVVAVAEGDSA